MYRQAFMQRNARYGSGRSVAKDWLKSQMKLKALASEEPLSSRNNLMQGCFQSLKTFGSASELSGWARLIRLKPRELTVRLIEVTRLKRKLRSPPRTLGLKHLSSQFKRSQ